MPSSSTKPNSRGALRELGLCVGKHAPGPLNHILDVPGGVGIAHRSYRDPAKGVCTGFTVIQTSARPDARRAAGFHALNASGELTGSHQIREWNFIETPVMLTNTPSVGRGYEAVSQWMMARHPGVGEDLGVVIPVVGECDDSVLHDPRAVSWGNAEVAEALDEALRVAESGKFTEAALEQGDVGAGTGTIVYDLKGGIGSASRVVAVDGKSYTVGVLVQTNFGLRDQLMMLGRNLGPALDKPLPAKHREGSCIGILATDAPLDSHALDRLAVRMGLGLARTGSHAHHGSGEIFMAFSTATQPTVQLQWDGDQWNPFLQAAVEATEEAVYHSFLYAKPVENSRARVAALTPEDVTKFFGA